MRTEANWRTNQQSQIFLAFFILACILDLCVIGFQWEHTWRYITKPALMPLLIFYYLSLENSIHRKFIAGLLFSFLGDVCLLISGGFVAGLSSFLIAHILYIFTFRSKFQFKNYTYLLSISIYIIGLLGFLFPHLGVMKIPVIIYASTIGGMMYMAMGTRQKSLLVGAFLFVISDSILALNLFYQHSTIGSLSVMFTYVLAQYFLVRGMLSTTPHSL